MPAQPKGSTNSVVTIALGLTFSEQRLLPELGLTGNDLRVYGPDDFTSYLEAFYALGAPAVNRSALRTEQYRQLLREHLSTAAPVPFYGASFAADQFATAEELLARRDEILDAGYQLAATPESGCPDRIRVLHEIEALALEDNGLDLMAGAADRLELLLGALEEDRHPQLMIYLNEPRELLPAGLRRLLLRLESLGDTVASLPSPAPATAGSDLGRWQAALQGNGKADLSGDGSLVILRAARETHLAAYLARVLRQNPDYRPGLLLSVRNQTLENAMAAEGLPSLGVPSTSLARPSLQVLKLITAFLWKPYEVERIMEFVSLVTKPLHWQLAQRIATYLADTPGFFGPRWFAVVEGFFSEISDDPAYSATEVADIRKQYDRWFGRRRYAREERVPKYDLRVLFNELREWAFEERSQRRKRDVKKQRPVGDYVGLLVLSAQAQRALELLDAQPEAELSLLEIERLVRTVYEPAPTEFQVREQGAPPTIFAPASAVNIPGGASLENLVWWDFIEYESDYFFSRYYPDELTWLTDRQQVPNGPEKKNALAAWQSLRPVLHAQQQLVLCLPENVNGAHAEAHPLFGDLEAAFPDGALSKITINVDAAGVGTPPGVTWTLPDFAPEPVVPLGRPVPQLTIDRMAKAEPRDKETPTAMEDLLYYPYKWVFRHQLDLRGTPILSISSENRLRGNLSHLFIELLLNDIKDGVVAMEKTAVEAWIYENAERLMQREGAVLLEYGQEPERVQFIRTMAYSAWSLVHYIKENGWTIRGSEVRLSGALEPMGGQEVVGRADLVLEREQHGKFEVALVDLKWRGKSVFRNLLRNAKDVQLCLYAEFIRQNQPAGEAPAGRQPDSVHTAYYVIRDAQMLSRNELAFANIETVSGPEEAGVIQQDTLRKIKTTFNWRWEQFADGIVEVRCKETLGHLEDIYLNEPHDERLEMETDDARFDDYRSLIGLVR